MEKIMNTLEVQDFNYKLGQVKKSVTDAEIDKGLVNIKGKIYSTVGLRITKLREHFGIAISVEMIVHENTDDKVMVECRINLHGEEKSQLLSNGFAEKKRSLNFITKTAAIEFCQTTALGRACAGLGIISDHNIASAEEIYGATDDSDKPNNKTKIGVIEDV
jgi:hypothetical protein